MKDKIRNFFAKLNNSYVIAAICAMLIGVILLGAMIALVAKPFSTNTTYSSERIETSGFGTIDIELTLLDDGRYAKTTHYIDMHEVVTTFGDYSYGRKHIYIEDEHRLCNVIWFDDEFQKTLVEVKNPFKLQYYGMELTNVDGILLLVWYCVLIAAAATIATILLVKRKNGKIVFTDRLRLIRRIKELETMLGAK